MALLQRCFSYSSSWWSEMFESQMYAARGKLVITTLYYVPDEPKEVAAWPVTRRLRNNVIAMLGPVL